VPQNTPSGRPAQGQQAPSTSPNGPGESGYDPDRTVSIARPKGPFTSGPEQGRPPQEPGDEGAISTMRIQAPKSGSPGQQVYPPTSPPAHRQQPMPQPQQRQPAPPDAQQYGQPPAQQGQPAQQGFQQGQGLGTDLFAIAGEPEQQPAGNRNGMLVLMAVAAAAAVVIAVLIVALFSS
jgi:hypothetical protein